MGSMRLRWGKRTVLAVGAAALVAAGLGVAGLRDDGAEAAGATVIPPVRDCASLVEDLDIPDAPTHVTAATVVPAQSGTPEFCEVRGYVEPKVQFVVKLPTTTFTGRYVQFGCGGFCGAVVPPGFPNCAPDGAEPGDAAVAATDDGHEGAADQPAVDGTFGENDQPARDDWFFRAPHVLSLAAKRLVDNFYGAPPTKSYFTGCSNGGREAMLLAQRYPTDFDGIVAGAPAFPISPLLGMFQAWLARSNTAADGTPILTAAKLPALHDAAVAACDEVDGLADGQLDDPRACDFDPGTVQCPGADAPTCLTAAQVDVVRKLYAGPTDPDGTPLYPGGEAIGSELAWNGWIIPAADGPTAAAALADGYLRHVGYPIGTPHSSLAEVEFTRAEFDRQDAEGSKGNATSLDLSAFTAHGGKLVIWHGWSDEAIPPVGTLDYYQRLADANGGLAATRQWARTFMVPSMYHCGRGYQLTEFDPLRELVSWVENGTAPDRVIATGRDANGTVTRTRTVFPYPQRAVYDGSGSVDDAANFVPADPPTPPQDKIDWAGAGLYQP
jgi:tannase/feruloyl esterase